MKKKALITGITGQDGSYLAEYLLEKGYSVIGLIRRTSTQADERIKDLLKKIELVNGDLLDASSLHNVISEYKPDEIYNLASQSYVPLSWSQAETSADITALGVVRLLESIRMVDTRIKLFQASSSAMYGVTDGNPINENTPFNPKNPYGVAKLYAHYMLQNYVEHYGMFCVSGILFNHESPRRGLEFVTKKIASSVAKIKKGTETALLLGNLDSKKDWGFAGDYVKAMHLMLSNKEPVNYVVGTGQTHSVRDFCEIAFKYVGLDYKDYVKVDEKFVRKNEVNVQVSDPSMIEKDLGWKAEVSFKELVEMMVEDEMKSI